MKIDDFFERGSSLPIHHFKFGKALTLSDEDFAQLYLAIMTEYKVHNGWWSEKRVPHCNECREEISGPAELRRLYGKSLHPDCFRKVYQEETKHSHKEEKQYWERVAALDLTGLEARV